MANNNQLYIPEKLKIGFQPRPDTYTKRLGFLTYLNKKGEWAKQKSWEGWRDKKLAPKEFDNVPTSGLVLNRGAGGVRESYGHNARQEYVRVWDPRDFEIEITVPNLLLILRDIACLPGKGLDGEFVYAWGGPMQQQLVLLPVISQEYKASQEFTRLQTTKVTHDVLVPGGTYLTRKQRQLVYLGHVDYFFAACGKLTFNPATSKSKLTLPPKVDRKGVLKKYAFWDPSPERYKPAYFYLDKLDQIAALLDPGPHVEFQEQVEQYARSPHGSRAVALAIRANTRKHAQAVADRFFYIEELPGQFGEFSLATRYTGGWSSRTKIDYVEKRGVWFIRDGVLTFNAAAAAAPLPGGSIPDEVRGLRLDAISPVKNLLFAKLESGANVQVTHQAFAKAYNNPAYY